MSEANMRIVMQLIILVMLPVVMSGCIRIARDPERSGTIYVGEPVMSKAIDERGDPIEPTTVFKTTDKRIYCTIDIRGPDHVRLGARWYYGDKLIYDRVIDFGRQRRGGWWVDVGPDGKFPPGDYRVEIYLLKDPIRTSLFQVTE